MFGGVELNPPMTIGLSMSTLGGIWYGQIKYNDTVRNSSNKDTSSSNLPTSSTSSNSSALKDTNIAGLPPSDGLENGEKYGNTIGGGGNLSPRLYSTSSLSSYPTIHIDKMDNSDSSTMSNGLGNSNMMKEANGENNIGMNHHHGGSNVNSHSPKLVYIAGTGKLY